MIVKPIEVKLPSIYECISCGIQGLKGWIVESHSTEALNGSYCDLCYQIHIQPKTDKPMTDLQKQHQLAAEWH
jgi:transcription elongation factor Elf1